MILKSDPRFLWEEQNKLDFQEENQARAAHFGSTSRTALQLRGDVQVKNVLGGVTSDNVHPRALWTMSKLKIFSACGVYCGQCPAKGSADEIQDEIFSVCVGVCVCVVCVLRTMSKWKTFCGGGGVLRTMSVQGSTDNVWPSVPWMMSGQMFLGQCPS